MQCQEAVHKAERLESANSELQQQRACLIAEKAAIEESLTTMKGDLESKSRELQSLRVSSDSAKETLLQQQAQQRVAQVVATQDQQIANAANAANADTAVMTA
jgi:hypothetical protein